jgi:4-phosphopantoate--beta-alanine ligase
MARKIVIPASHPRYHSLVWRERLVDGFRKGLVAHEGLIAHGRGESFDYLLGEKTSDFALSAIDAAAAVFLLAQHPVISVNGNAAALCAKDLCDLNRIMEKSFIEINLFYSTLKRKRLIAKELKRHGAENILGINQDSLVEIPELESSRRKVDPDGIYKADVVFVPLEDGDRTIALKKMKKKVITVDLNPLSRTALTADITIVDNMVRAVPLIIDRIKHHKNDSCLDELKDIVKSYNNNETLTNAVCALRSSKSLNGC